MSRRMSLRAVLSQLRAGKRRDLDGALNGLHGCPVGGWGETAQAMRRLADELPPRSERTWTLDAIVDATMRVDHAGRYRRVIDEAQS